MTDGPIALVVGVPWVPHYPPFGGSAKRILRLVEAIQRSGADPHLLAAGAADDAVVAALGKRGIRLEGLETWSRRPLRRLQAHALRRPAPYVPSLGPHVKDLIAQRRPAFVQFEGFQSIHRALLGGVSSVLSTHAVDSERISTVARGERPGTPDWWRHWNHWQSVRAAQRRGVRRADVVLCISDHDCGHFARRARRTLLVPNGADDEFFQIDPQLPDTETVLFFGTFGYEPNAHGVSRFLRDGWPAVLRERPNANLRLVGPGLTGELGAVVAASERVEAVGSVERLDRELARSRAVVVPIWQGGGTVLKLVEALAAARPVAATQFVSTGLGLGHRQHGLVGEGPLDLARAIVTLLTDRALSGSLAAEGRKLAERYRWRSVTAPAEQLYRGWVEHALRSREVNSR